jgi:hypothetical protein
MSVDDKSVDDKSVTTADSVDKMSIDNATPIASPVENSNATLDESPNKMVLEHNDSANSDSPNASEEKTCNKSAVKIIAKMYPTQYKNSQGYYIGDYRVMIDSEKFPATSFDKVDLMLNSLFKDMINGNLKENDPDKIDSKDLIPSYETEFVFEPIQYSDKQQQDLSLDASIDQTLELSPNESIVSAISTPNTSPDVSTSKPEFVGPVKKGGQTKKKRSKRSNTRKNRRKQKK